MIDNSMVYLITPTKRKVFTHASHLADVTTADHKYQSYVPSLIKRVR